MESIVSFPLIGLGFLVVGIILMFNGRHDVRRHRRLVGLRPRSLDAAAGGPVEVQGTIVPGIAGTLRAPLSGREVVWFRIVVEEENGDDNTETIIGESDSREFHLDDGRGRARIEPAGAHVVVEPETVASSGIFRDATPELQAFLGRRGVESTGKLGFNRRLTYREERLHPGDRLLAFGTSQRHALPSPSERDYRKPATELVLSSGLDGDDELILTTHSRSGLARRMLIAPLAGAIMAAVGVGLLVARLLGQ